MALRELTTILGPFPEDWIVSLGTPEAHPWNRRFFSLGSLEASHSSSTGDTSLDQRVRSLSEVDDTLGLVTVLQQILVLNPFQRPDVSVFLHHPWFVDSSSPATPSGSASE